MQLSIIQIVKECEEGRNRKQVACEHWKKLVFLT